MASFSDRELLTRLYQALTTDGSGNVCFRYTASGFSADSVNDTHIDWGTGTNQVSAVDVPIADSGNYFTTDNIEAALQQIGATIAVAGAPADATYITQVANGTLTNEQALSALATGIVKNTTTTGVLSIATEGTDYWKPGGTDVAVADGGTGSSTAADARTALGLVIGTNVQAYDAELAALAGLTSAADKLPYFTGSGTASVADFTAAGRALIDDADAATQRATLGLGTIATQAANSVSITGGSITGITDLVVADGGTGVSTLTGLVKGNGTSAFTAAAQGTDYWAPGGTDVAVADGGTGSSTASTARTALGAAASGANSDLTALSGIAAAAGIVMNPHNTSTGNTSEIRFLELAANGTNYVGFKAPDTIAANKIWVLPVADGSANQCLVTDGSLALSFATAPSTNSIKYIGYSDSGTVTNPTSLTLFDTHQYTIPANDLIAGVAYEFEFGLAMVQGTTSVWTYSLRLGSTTIVSVQWSTASSNNVYIRGTIYGTAAAGAAVSVRGTMMGCDQEDFKPYGVTTAGTVATNGSLVLALGWTVAGSHASNSGVMKTALVRKISTTAF